MSTATETKITNTVHPVTRTKNLTSSIPSLFSLSSLRVFSVFLLLLTLSPFKGYCTEQEKIKTIGISQIVEHPALNDVRAGILQGLKENGFEEKKNLKVIYENAQGNLAVSTQIANKLLSEKPDVCVSISTPSSQTLFFAAKKAGLETPVPVVFTAVSDPAAAKLEPGQPPYPITGITDAPDLKGLLEVVDTLMPNLKTLGLMYNPSEVNSVSTITQLRKLLSERGIKPVEVTVNSSNDVAQATQSLIGKVDALYFPQDNTVVSAIDTVISIASQSTPSMPVILPIFTSDAALVKKGVLAGVGYDYKDVGLETGIIVARILKGEKANDIPIQSPKPLRALVNAPLAHKLGLKIPKEFKHSKIEVFK